MKKIHASRFINTKLKSDSELSDSDFVFPVKLITIMSWNAFFEGAI